MVAGLDLGIIVVYLIVVMTIGFILGKGEKADGFFVNNRRTGLFLLIFTTLSTSVGAGSVIGVASASFDTGISFGLTFMCLSLLGWFIMALLSPRIKEWADKEGAYTLGDYFRSRFSARTRRLVSLIILTTTVLFTAVQFVAFARLVESAISIDFNMALVGTALITIIYTLVAGIKGDFYTDSIQFFVMLPVFILLFIFGLKELGGISFITTLPAAHLDIFNYAGPSFFFGGIIFGFPLIIVGMDIWQRVFAAADGKTAQRAFLFSGLLKVVVIGAAIVFGFMAMKLFPDAPKDGALFALMRGLLPTGLLGLGFAGVLAILMSTIDSMLMVGSATLTKDFYLAKYPETDDKKKLRMGRLFVLYVGLVALVIAILFNDIVRISVTASQIVGVMAPALIGGLVSRKLHDTAAFWSIISGLVVTLVLIVKMPDTAAIPGMVVALLILFALSFKKDARATQKS